MVAGIAAGPSGPTVNSVARTVMPPEIACVVPFGSTMLACVPCLNSNVAWRLPDESCDTLPRATSIGAPKPIGVDTVSTTESTTSSSGANSFHAVGTLRVAERYPALAYVTMNVPPPATAMSYRPLARDVVEPSSGCPAIRTVTPLSGRLLRVNSRPRMTAVRVSGIAPGVTPVSIGFGPVKRKAAALANVDDTNPAAGAGAPTDLSIGKRSTNPLTS